MEDAGAEQERRPRNGGPAPSSRRAVVSTSIAGARARHLAHASLPRARSAFRPPGRAGGTSPRCCPLQAPPQEGELRRRAVPLRDQDRRVGDLGT